MFDHYIIEGFDSNSPKRFSEIKSQKLTLDFGETKLKFKLKRYLRSSWKSIRRFLRISEKSFQKFLFQRNLPAPLACS